MTHVYPPTLPSSEPLWDGLGRKLVIVGGAITLFVVPLVAGLILFFGLLLAASFGPRDQDLGLYLPGGLAAILIAEVVAVVTWLAGLRGNRLALSGLLVVGGGLALFLSRLFLEFYSEFDPLFVSAAVVAIGAPSLLAVGSALGLASGIRRPART